MLAFWLKVDSHRRITDAKLIEIHKEISELSAVAAPAVLCYKLLHRLLYVSSVLSEGEHYFTA